MTANYYETLGVDKSAPKEEIKKAFKKLAKKYHPDINKEEGSADKFKEINEAASVLLDDNKRAQYDQFGSVGGGGGSGFDFSGFDFSSFGSFDSAFDEILNAFSGGGFSRRRRGGPLRGPDLEYELEITLKDAAKGISKDITYDTDVSCEVCGGTGAESPDAISACHTCGGSGMVRKTQRTPFGVFASTAPCSTCGGTGKIIEKKCKQCGGRGKIRTTKTVSVEIPPGIMSGARLRVPGKGMAGDAGGEPGDLYVHIYVSQDERFERHGDDLHTVLPISVVQAALGVTIDIPTLDGDVALDVPAGTQPFQKLRVRGKGMPSLRSGPQGDLIVHAHVEIPKKLSKQAKSLLEEYARESKDAYASVSDKKSKKGIGNIFK